MFAGPGEATALGNHLVQMLAGKEFDSLEEARKCVFESFPMKKFEP